MPRQMPTTVKRKISWEQVRATASRRGGMTRRAATKTRTTIPAALPSANVMSATDPPIPPNIRTKRTIATTARS